MTKQEALSRAQAARHAAKLAQARAALYAASFGGGDKLTQQALMDADVAFEAETCWIKVSNMHHAKRAYLLRKQALPAFMFGYA